MKFFFRTTTFPFTTCAVKMIGAGLVDKYIEPGRLEALDLLGIYLIGSALWDGIEVINRILTPGELEDFVYLGEVGTPYSCFERHLFYDWPKVLRERIRNRKTL